MTNRRSMYVPPVDLYGPIHKALRWALCRALTRIGSTTVTDDAAVSAVITEVHELIVALEQHISHEEAFFHPAIEARRPGATDHLEDDHIEHANILAGLRVLLAAIRSGSPTTRPALWRALYLRFADLVAENIHHMAEEEEVTQPLLEELYTSEELMDLQNRLIASIAPDEMLASLKIMLPANDFAFRLMMLNNAKHAMPPEVFAGVFAQATVHLTNDEIEALAAKLLRNASVPAAAA
jgi:hypothetical protein